MNDENPEDPASSRSETSDAKKAHAKPQDAKPGGPLGAPPDRVVELETAVAALEDRLRRQQADFVNDVRRIQRQADERLRFAAQPVVSDLLGVADAIHQGLEGLGASEQERRVAEGLRLVERALLEALGRHGVERIDALGAPFDPASHEAVLEQPSEGVPPRTVLHVLRPGFTLHGRVVRPAHVIVSKAASAAAAADAEADAAPEAGED